jgi:stage II sporulation protein D
MGIVATYAGRPIDAQFHSSSGGMTEDPSIVWGGTVPYLKAVSSPEVGCPYSSWSVELKAADVAAKLGKAGLNVGTLLEVLPASVGASGRFGSALLRGTTGSVEIRGEKLRAILGLNSTLFYVEVLGGGPPAAVASPPAPALSAVPSPVAAAGLAPVAPAPPAGFRFVGRGFGHGVGMSQWGAQTMAQRGAGFSEILKHYYQGIELAQWAP